MRGGGKPQTSLLGGAVFFKMFAFLVCTKGNSTGVYYIGAVQIREVGRGITDFYCILSYIIIITIILGLGPCVSSHGV